MHPNFFTIPRGISLSPPIRQEFQEKSHLHPWPLGISWDHLMRIQSLSTIQSLNQTRNPQHHGYPGNGKARPKATVNLDKSHVNDNKATKWPNTCTMHPNLNNEITHASYYLRYPLVVASLPNLSLFSLVFLCLLEQVIPLSSLRALFLKVIKI